MRLQGLLTPIVGSGNFENILRGIKNNQFPININGLSESGKAYAIWSLFESSDDSIVVFTSSDMESKKLYEELSFFTTSTYYFPTKDIVFYNITATSGDLIWERLKVFKELIGNGKRIIVTSIETLRGLYIPMEVMKKYHFKVKEGKELDEVELVEKLVESGYEHVDVVEGRGQFSKRGGIIDIFPPVSRYPYRIELFGDEVDSIRTFNVESQRSIEKVKTAEITPAKEVIIPKEFCDNAIKAIKEDFEKVKISLKDDKEAKEKISGIVNKNIESLIEKGTFETVDSYVTYFYEKPVDFLQYFDNPIVIVDEVDRSIGKLESLQYEFLEDYDTFLSRGDILPKQGDIVLSKDVIVEKIEGSKLLTLSMLAKGDKYFPPYLTVSLNQITLNSYQGKTELFIEDIKERKANGDKIVVLSGTRARGERLGRNLREDDIEAIYKDSFDEILDGQIMITFGMLDKGFQFPDLGLSVISDKELFGQGKRKTKKKKKAKGVGKIKSFTELKPGDYVVHVSHGIGVYKGITQLEIDNVKKDFLEISYANDAKVYVPVEQLDLIQKYIGSEGVVPKINKLGGNEWQKAKNKVRTSINAIAEDLVKLYAARSAVTGYSYRKDTPWQKQFEDEFPYEETEDQLLAIEDIKKDMESNKPMDRLLCGDVGYGKTEVAMRAAFKAVMDGKQVAILVPTTILAEQHYKNFKERFSGFPVNIDMISRFKTVANIKKTLTAVKEGNVDILIGTHKILGSSVQFKDLGLLIIDEEQRFGVRHKEKIKEFKKNVDVLTLTATPIPRTLHMSLTGVRGISVIETPPENRYPVQTYVVEYNDQLIRDAILREINRGGQVFFVYNRVDSILEMESYLSKIVPEARIITANGRMKEKELENVMSSFMSGEYDILLATTIIETGIDIQNANTMIIYDADRMGLSQLYQLRGRVGRTNRIAYAYLTYRKDKVITEVAEKRLKAIKDFTELGSGFKVAMRDLEIRGAGNLMGSAQHGHMASIGYDLYCKMLEDTIKVIKGDIDQETVDTVVDIKVNAYIPNDYIEDEVTKIEIYKKIASIESNEEKEEVVEEIIDRFGDIPTSVNNLIDISYIRILGKALGIIEIKDRNSVIDIKFDNRKRITSNMITKVIEKYSKNISFKDGENPIMAYSIEKRDQLLVEVKTIIEDITKFVEE
ncbi:transcription-repair coupling factor [uncultured Clostridium sp.]|uniref:transcription-repair coupling factor n=1 Tax=uncultured Clostridium sp. TaxID=59620 RepID=UPI0025F37C89|nr:transcription-repair coupling factor [uncultured Clostridium sp.]